MPMDKPSPELKARLARQILDPRTQRDELGVRGSQSEDDGRSYGGRPRMPGKRKRQPKSIFDSLYTGPAR